MAPKKQAAKASSGTPKAEVKVKDEVKAQKPVEQKKEAQPVKPAVEKKESVENVPKQGKTPTPKPETAAAAAKKIPPPPSGVSWVSSVAVVLVAFLLFAYVKQDEWRSVFAIITSTSTPSHASSESVLPPRIPNHPYFPDLSTAPLLQKDSIRVALSVPFPLVRDPLPLSLPVSPGRLTFTPYFPPCPILYCLGVTG